jgi:serine protease Do
MRSPRNRVLAAAFFVALGVLAGLTLSVSLDLGRLEAGRTSVVADSPKAVFVPGKESPFVAVADRVVSGVVAIATKTNAGPAQGDRLRGFHPWGEMFDELFPNNPQDPNGREQPFRRPQGSGSGFFMDERGYVLTNNHVVQNADDVTVTLADGTELHAEVVGQDPETDVAVVKVDPSKYSGKLPSLEFGDSDAIRVGDWAIAVGNPFGQLAGSLTVGVISAKGRDDLNIMGGTPAYQNFIQTDASINFGNSGGPLVNIDGRVIGMNTAINPAGQGIGFAIPINMASRIAEELISQGRVVRGYLGIYPQELTPEIAESFDISNTEGILIGDVVDGTPAKKAGLNTGDVILEMNGKRVSDVNAFRLEVADQRVGEKIELLVLRDGQKKRIDVVLDERPNSAVARGDKQETEVWAGLAVEDLDSQAARRFVPDREEVGVLVVGVEPGSPADDAGIQVGDIVKEIGNVEIQDRADYNESVEKYKDKSAVAILLKRGNQTLYVGLKP